MARPLSAASALLRSRRFALWLLGLSTAYVAIASLVPQQSVTSIEQMSEWLSTYAWAAPLVEMLGMNRAFSTPVFLTLAMLLTISTGICAWERTVRSFRDARRASGADAALAEQAIHRPTALIELDPSIGAAEALSRSAAVLRSFRMRVHAEERQAQGVSAVYAFIGSPLFHWALAALFVFAGLGQATKWEGFIGVPVGHELLDQESVYGHVVKGPLRASAGSGMTVAVPEFAVEHEAGGVERGHAPYVRLQRADRVVAEGFVFPNRPLNAGSLWIHRSEWGLAVVAAIETADGVEVGRRNLLYDFDRADEAGLITFELDLPAETGLSVATVSVPLDRAAGGGQSGFRVDLPADPGVVLAAAGESAAGGTRLEAGDVFELPEGGYRLRIVDVDRYARLFVVNDWSIPFVYASLVLASVGMALALMTSPRIAVCRIVDCPDGGQALHVLVRARRIDPAFSPRVVAALRESVSAV